MGNAWTGLGSFRLLVARAFLAFLAPIVLRSLQLVVVLGLLIFVLMVAFRGR